MKHDDYVVEADMDVCEYGKGALGRARFMREKLYHSLCLHSHLG